MKFKYILAICMNVGIYEFILQLSALLRQMSYPVLWAYHPVWVCPSSNEVISVHMPPLSRKEKSQASRWKRKDET